MHLSTESFRVKLDREVFLSEAKLIQESPTLFVMVFDLDALLNYFVNIGFLVLLVIIVGRNCMFKLIPSGSPDLIIGTLIALLARIHLGNIFKL